MIFPMGHKHPLVSSRDILSGILLVRLAPASPCGYDAFFKDPARGLIEVGCWSHYPDTGIIQRECMGDA
jgi:hypothetical protein